MWTFISINLSELFLASNSFNIGESLSTSTTADPTTLYSSDNDISFKIIFVTVGGPYINAHSHA